MAEIRILGVRVDSVEKKELERSIVECVERKTKHVYAYVNVHAINLARKDEAFRDFLNKAYCVYCDGEGVRLGARILGVHQPPRTVLTRWIWELGSLFQERGYRVFLLGGQAGTVAAAAKRFLSRCPRLKIAGFHHGYFDTNGDENAGVLEAIKRGSPDILFVGLGMPEQEKWIDRNLDQLSVHAVIPCGGMIDYLSGELPVAPGWMSEHGLEWLHRLIQDPARLWVRYLVGNPAFVFRVVQERIRSGARR